MRDPARIHKFCDELAAIWAENAPDWRFGQFICNTFGEISAKVDPFFPEEKEMLEMLRECFVKEEK